MDEVHDNSSEPKPEDTGTVHDSVAPHDAATPGESVLSEPVESYEPVATASQEDIASQEDVADEVEEESVDDGSYSGMLESDETSAQPTGDRKWYILKVASNREDSIKDALQRKINIAGLQGFFGDIIVPVEMRTEFKNGKKKVVKVKLYPGYLVVHMELNDDTWFLVRETPGIGDFTGAGGKPQPMPASEVARIVTKVEEKVDESPKIKLEFKPQDRVRINDGMFTNFEGHVEAIDETNGRVTVMINIFGRSTPVELEYWQVEKL